MNNQDDISLKSYSPYSGIQESCYVEGKSGIYYPGVKVENISYPLTISSVQAAICSCLANDDKPLSIYQNEPKSELFDFWVKEFDLKVQPKLPENLTLYNPILSVVDDIKSTLKSLCSKAVTIHSDFPVSALLNVDGGFIPGVNVEVNIWSLGLCAERVAITRAIAYGISKFGPMYIHAPKSEFCSPCGACRQVMNEFMPDEVVELYHKDESKSTHFIHHLLPYGIISDSLKKH